MKKTRIVWTGLCLYFVLVMPNTLRSVDADAPMQGGVKRYFGVRAFSWGAFSTRETMRANQEDDPLDQLADEEARVKELFRQFRAGDYHEHGFPELAWDDIPALLKMAESKRELTNFPRNPISSQYERESLEGVVALWLVEGLRAGGKFPSLNALCLDKRADARRDFEAQSRASHDRVLALYTQWWKSNSMRPAADARRDNPLEATPYSWY